MAGSQVAGAGKADQVAVAVGRSHQRARCNLPEIAAGDDPAGVILQRDHAPVAGAAQALEDAPGFVVEVEAQEQGAQYRAVLRQHACAIQQVARLARKQVAADGRLDVRCVARQHLGEQGVLHAPGLRAAGQARHYFAGRRDQDHVTVDRVQAHVSLQARLHRGAAGCGAAARGGGEIAQGVVHGQKPDIGRALEQVAHQDIDGHLRLRREFLHPPDVRRGRQVVQQAFSEAGKGGFGIADFSGGAGQLPQQVEHIPDRL
jgi:hypothetical protein